MVGRRHEATFVVTARHTATAVGSGELEVLGTPALIAWLESVTLPVVSLSTDQVSLGVHIDVAHEAPSTVGMSVSCQATLTAITGVRLAFEVQAFNPDGTRVAHGRIDRVVVGRQRFLARLHPKAEE